MKIKKIMEVEVVVNPPVEEVIKKIKKEVDIVEIWGEELISREIKNYLSREIVIAVGVKNPENTGCCKGILEWFFISDEGVVYELIHQQKCSFSLEDDFGRLRADSSHFQDHKTIKVYLKKVEVEKIKDIL